MCVIPSDLLDSFTTQVHRDLLMELTLLPAVFSVLFNSNYPVAEEKDNNALVLDDVVAVVDHFQANFVERKWRSTMDTNDELLQHKIRLAEEVDKMKDK